MTDLSTGGALSSYFKSNHMIHPLKVTHLKLGADEAVDVSTNISDEEIERLAREGVLNNANGGDLSLNVGAVTDLVALQILGPRAQNAARFTRWDSDYLRIHPEDPLYLAIRASVQRQLEAAAEVQS